MLTMAEQDADAQHKGADRHHFIQATPSEALLVSINPARHTEQTQVVHRKEAQH